MPETALSLVDRLSNELKNTNTLKTLRDKAGTEAFKTQVRELSAKDQEDLRGIYRELYNLLRHVVKPEELSGVPIKVDRAQQVNTKHGLTYYLRGTRIETGTQFECWAPGTSINAKNPTGGPVVRFFHRLNLTDYPIDVIMVKGPHPTDTAKTLYQIERYNTPEQTSFVPF